jgi:hypothetical protein
VVLLIVSLVSWNWHFFLYSIVFYFSIWSAFVATFRVEQMMLASNLRHYFGGIFG